MAQDTPIARWRWQFAQQVPNEVAAPTERTEVRFLYDDDALYIAARMYDSQARPASRGS